MRFLVELGESGTVNAVHPNTGQPYYVGIITAPLMPTDDYEYSAQAKGPTPADILELVRSGLSAEDIVKLKHANLL